MRILPPLAIAALVAGCASGSASPPVESRPASITFSHQVDPRNGGLTFEQLRDLAPRVATIQPEVDSVTIAPGETISALQFSARVLDSAGATLGLLRRYDFALTYGAATMDSPPTVRGVKEGMSLLRISYPKRLWVGRTDAPPERFIRVIVRPR
jgi:hypothetical protein